MIYFFRQMNYSHISRIIISCIISNSSIKKVISIFGLSCSFNLQTLEWYEDRI